MAPSKPDDAAESRDFVAFLMDRPRTHGELSDGLRDMVAKVVETGKAGTLSLSIRVAPFEKDVSRLIVTEEIRLKLPEHDRPAGIFFPDRDNNLTKDDPNAFPLFRDEDVRNAPAGTNFATGEVKELGQ